MAKWYLYILHFDKPYKHARHYVGIALDPEKRFEDHKAGRGAVLTRIVREAGIDIAMSVMGSFEGFSAAHSYEKKIKANGHTLRHCPICKEQER